MVCEVLLGFWAILGLFGLWMFGIVVIGLIFRPNKNCVVLIAFTILFGKLT